VAGCKKHGFDGLNRVISDCHSTVQLNHFIPGFLSHSVAVFLRWQSDMTLGLNLDNEMMKAPDASEPLAAFARRYSWLIGNLSAASADEGDRAIRHCCFLPRCTRTSFVICR
jgi:hypothetical protein